MKLYLSLFLLCVTLNVAYSVQEVKSNDLLPDIVRLCSSFCANRPQPKCKTESEPAIYAPLDEIVGNKSPAVNVEAKVFGRNPDTSVVPGHKGKAIYLPNSGTYDDHYIDFGRFEGECINNIDLCDNGYTVSFWYKMANGNHPYPVLASASDWQLWSQDTPVGHGVYMSWYKKDGRRWKGGGKHLPNEVWHHVALVARSRLDIKYYVNGDLTVTGDKLQEDHVENIRIKNIELGCYSRSNCVAATYDEFKIWEEAKTDEEIKDIFKSKYRR